MTIKVGHIDPGKDMETAAYVTFYDEANSPHFSAEVLVFVDNRDRLISEVEAEAIEKAKAFLLLAASSH